jgi:DNA repair protein RecO (recombination protein O)
VKCRLIKEFSVSFTPYDIYSNIKKSCVAIFLGEVLTSVLKEETPHDECLIILKSQLCTLKIAKRALQIFILHFWQDLSSFLGFEPHPRLEKEDSFFDMVNGIFVPVPPVHGNYANEEITNILAEFFVASYDSINNISLTGKMRNDVLETLVRFYSLHLPGLKKIKSLDILKEVFS